MPPAFNLSQDQTLQFNLCLSLFFAGIEREELNSSFRLLLNKRELRKIFESRNREIPPLLSELLKLPDVHTYRFVESDF